MEVRKHKKKIKILSSHPHDLALLIKNYEFVLEKGILKDLQNYRHAIP